MADKILVNDLVQWKHAGRKFAVVTAYDYTSATLVAQAGIPAILVGDSLGMTMLGYDSTVKVDMEDMIRACRAVKRGSGKALVIADMPFMTYATPEMAIDNATLLVQEGGADAVKLEGGRIVADTVRLLVEFGIPVMGHIGVTPQHILKFGRYRVQGRDEEIAERLSEDAFELEKAGVFSMVLELVEPELARRISEARAVPTIGIGAGEETDAQVQVFHDVVGLTGGRVPKHALKRGDAGEVIVSALKQYAEYSEGL